jgi:hypothetical protein
MSARRTRQRSHHRPDDSPPEPAPAPVPAALGDGPDGDSGPVPPPAPAGVGFELWRRTVSAARLVIARTAVVGPTVETVVWMWAGVSSNACSPATTLPGLAGASAEVDAGADDDTWSADRDAAGAFDVPRPGVTAGVASEPI